MHTYLYLSILIFAIYLQYIQAPIPFGCECENRNVDINDCLQFDCKCICDLTSLYCDFNCYCDPDCTDEDKATFTSPLLEVSPKKYLPLCDQLDYNSEDPFQVLFNSMCITRNNNPSKGQYYISQTYPDPLPSVPPSRPSTYTPNTLINITTQNTMTKIPVDTTFPNCNFFPIKFLNTDTNNHRGCYLPYGDTYLNAQFYINMNLPGSRISTNADTVTTDFAARTGIVNKVVYNFTVINNQSNFEIDLLTITINATSLTREAPVLVDHMVIYTLIDTDITNSTLLPFQKSGNPGYINGFPVVTNQGNFQVPAPTPGGCQLSHTLSYNENYFTICPVNISTSDYALDPSTTLDAYITTSETLFAKYGNSDINKTDEYFNITIEPYQNLSNFISYCVIIQKIHYEFLTTASGRHGNPQNTIFGGRLRFSYISVPCDVTYTLNLEVSASFLEVEEKKLSNFVSRLPNIIMDLIYTWFEPFFYKSYDPNKI